jgi:hypothetical protein
MKNISLLIVAICINVSLLANRNSNNKILALGDSTLRQRFIKNVLQEYEMEGRWIFVKVDSMYKLKNNYEVINPKTLYNSYASQFTSYNGKRFVFDVSEALTEEITYERYPNRPLIKGVKVNMKLYKTLLKQPKEKILSIYFNADKTLKKQYKKWLYEIIAVCYTNNVKVVTPSNAQPYYEVFK